MSKEVYPSSPDGFETSDMDRLHLTRAISNAHQKLLLARKRDLLLIDAKVESGYRFHKDFPDYADGKVGRSDTVVLVPPTVELKRATIARLGLVMPTKSWDEASKFLQDLHRTNLEVNAPDELSDESFTNPMRVPTADVFGEAFNDEGDRIQFLLTPSGLYSPFESEDIQPSPEVNHLEGSYYQVDSNFGSETERARLLTEWFNAEQLADLIETYDPITFDGQSIAGNAA